MKYPRLRIAWSVQSSVLCLLLIALWVRSYWRMDSASSTATTTTIVKSDLGGIEIYRSGSHHRPPQSWRYYGYEQAQIPWTSMRLHAFAEFAWTASASNWKIIVPYWLPVLFLGAISAAPLIRLSKRFSLRTLLIGMTVVAAVLGLAPTSNRS